MGKYFWPEFARCRVNKKKMWPGSALLLKGIGGKMQKKLLLGSVAAFFTVAGAQAADLPLKAKAVEYVKICPGYGPGFIAIPGTDTCLQISGYLRADFNYNGVAAFNPYITGQIDNGTLNRTTSFARAIAYFDARTETDYGTLRGYVGFGAHMFTWDTPEYGWIQSHYLPRAFIQFAGFTAGYTQSFFDPVDAVRTFLYTTAYTRSDRWTNLLAYTHEFGDGLSASVSIEDGYYRYEGTGFYYSPLTNETDKRAGNGLPDLVLNLRFDQSWGAVQLNGALHQTRVATQFSNFESAADQVGWAVGGVVALNLPMIKEGDQIYVTGAYTDGAMSYAGLSGNPTSPSSSVFGQITNGGTAGAYYRTGDVVWDGIDSYETSKAWSISTQYRHNWLPNLRSGLYAGYLSIDAPETNYARQHGYMDFNLWQAGGNLVWFPAKQLEIGVEILYSRVESSTPFMVNGCISSLPASAGSNFSCGGSVGAWTAGLRFQRLFGF